MRDGQGPERLRDLLDPLGRKLGMDGAVEAGRVFARWSAIVGSDIAAHVEPTSLRDGTLRVRADSPAWATEIGYLAGEIAARINSAVGRRVVKDLRVTSGPRRNEARSVTPGKPGPGPRAVVSDGPPEDPREALERARRAWAARNQKRPSDQDF